MVRNGVSGKPRRYALGVRAQRRRALSARGTLMVRHPLRTTAGEPIRLLHVLTASRAPKTTTRGPPSVQLLPIRSAGSEWPS